MLINPLVNGLTEKSATSTEAQKAKKYANHFLEMCKKQSSPLLTKTNMNKKNFLIKQVKLFALGFLFLITICVIEGRAQTEIVVAVDGSGKFKTIQEAIMSVPSGTRANPVIIKQGIYKELIYVQREKRFFI